MWKYWGAPKKGKQFKGLVCSGCGNKENQLGAQWCYHCRAPLPQLAPARSPVAQGVWAPRRRGPPGWFTLGGGGAGCGGQSTGAAGGGAGGGVSKGKGEGDMQPALAGLRS
eukprot:2004274-Pyramimonas_sp.AAC.1